MTLRDIGRQRKIELRHFAELPPLPTHGLEVLHRAGNRLRHGKSPGGR
jgi:hypothetical protein